MRACVADVVADCVCTASLVTWNAPPLASSLSLSLVPFTRTRHSALTGYSDPHAHHPTTLQ